MKYDWLKWLCIGMVIEGLWVQSLLRTKLIFFLAILDLHGIEGT